MAYLERLVHQLSRWLNWVAIGSAVLMMLLVGANVVLRPFGLPILGSYEFVEFLMVILIAFALAHTAVVKGHIAVTIFVDRFPQRTRAIVDNITCSVSLAVFTVVTWQMILYGIDMWQAGLLSFTVRAPLFPFIFGVAFSFAVLCFVLLVDLGRMLVQATRK